MRIVSLIPSGTEIVCALGYGGELAGRSHECDYPESVNSLAVCTRLKVDCSGSSGAIDDAVQATLAEGESIYEVLGDQLRELKPDVIVTQSMCSVCAVSDEDIAAAMGAEFAKSVKIVSLGADRLDGVWSDMMRVAEALGSEESGRELVARLRGRLEAIRERAGELSTRPRTASIEWLDPLMSAGNWSAELVEIAGGEELFGEVGAASVGLRWEKLLESDPEVIVVMPCGFDLARVRSEMGALTGRRGWEGLSAVREGRVYLCDGSQYFNRPGPRLIESVEILAEIFHGEEFDFGHENRGWRRYSES